MRHPNVLAFLHSTEAEMMDVGAVKPTIYLVTEPVMPLADKIKELNLKGTQRCVDEAWHTLICLQSFLVSERQGCILERKGCRL